MGRGWPRFGPVGSSRRSCDKVHQGLSENLPADRPNTNRSWRTFWRTKSAACCSAPTNIRTGVMKAGWNGEDYDAMEKKPSGFQQRRAHAIEIVKLERDPSNRPPSGPTSSPETIVSSPVFEPFAWFHDVLPSVPAHSITQLSELLRHNWKPPATCFAKECVTITVGPPG